ncbi:hypothetical protein B0G84_8804 [Paraburkholderia sp. BL8N3]|nr:DUF1109 domain-containing protein [Paraburkholderia sp. BL8N3]TCK32890.1 hypothetical protein B0G84_8804 [Paraburkholderia sp. BL8N3]
MKTADLITLLVTDLAPQDRGTVLRRFSAALLGGSGLAVAGVFLWGVRPDLFTMLNTPFFLFKLSIPLLLIAVTVWLAARLAIPGARTKRAWGTLVLAYTATWALALAVLWRAPMFARSELILGHTWRSCPLYIAVLSIPTFIALSWAMRGLAPTRPRLAGAVAGLLAGAVGTFAYCLRCPEMSIPFWAFWYSAGLVITTSAGALLGRVALKWC